jgi:hypothetical protein
LVNIASAFETENDVTNQQSDHGHLLALRRHLPSFLNRIDVIRAFPIVANDGLSISAARERFRSEIASPTDSLTRFTVQRLFGFLDLAGLEDFSSKRRSLRHDASFEPLGMKIGRNSHVSGESEVVLNTTVHCGAYDSTNLECVHDR